MLSFVMIVRALTHTLQQKFVIYSFYEMYRVFTEFPINQVDFNDENFDEACKILHRAKSTVYALTQAHKIPFYQPEKMLQFKRSELMAWMENARQETNRQTRDKIINDMQQGIRHKPKSNWGMK